MWLYHSTCTKGKSAKVQLSWRGIYRVVTCVNDVVYRIQQHPRMKAVVVYLAPYQGTTQDDQPYGWNSWRRAVRDLIHEDWRLLQHQNWRKMRRDQYDIGIREGDCRLLYINCWALYVWGGGGHSSRMPRCLFAGA
jgi:hypothetical protein